MNTTSLVFQNTTFSAVDRNGDAWLRSFQIGSALGYKNPSADMAKLYDRHADEFTEDMTALVKLPTEGGEQEVRIFSPRGCYALAIFARTKVAKDFRRWVLDVLESIRKTGKYETPYSVGPRDSLTKEQGDTLRRMLIKTAELLPNSKQGAFISAGWSKLKSHFKCHYRQIPQHEFNEAVSILNRHIITIDSLLYLPQKADNSIAALKMLEQYIKGASFALSFDSNGKMQITEVQEKATVSPEEVLSQIAQPSFPANLLPALIQTAAKRMQSAMPALLPA